MSSFSKKGRGVLDINSAVSVLTIRREPLSGVNAILILDTYHHFEQPAAMLRHILQSLRPGGRLVVVDYSLPSHRLMSREQQAKQHELAPALVENEIRIAGLQIISRQDSVIPGG